MQNVLDRELSAPQDLKLRRLGQLSYLIHTFVAVSAVIPGVQPSILLLVVAFCIDMLNREDSLGTWHASHFAWRIRSVVIAGVLYLVTTPLWLLVIPGYIAWILISLWFLYRVVRGWLAMSKGQRMPDRRAD